MVITTTSISADASLASADTIMAGTTTANETAFDLSAELQPQSSIATSTDEGGDNGSAQQTAASKSCSQPDALTNLASSTLETTDESASLASWQSAQLTSQQFTPLQLSIEQTLTTDPSTAIVTATDATVPFTALSASSESATGIPETTTPLLPAHIKKTAADHTTAAVSKSGSDTLASDFTPWQMQISTTPAAPLAETPQTVLTPNTTTGSDNTSDASAELLTTTVTATAPTMISVKTETSDLTDDSPWLTSTNATLSATAAQSMTNTEQWSGAKNTSTHNATEQHELNQLLASVLTSATSQQQPSTSVANSSNSAAATTSTSAQQLGEQLLDTLKQQVSLQLTQQSQQATIRLDPPHLGQLEIAIRLDGDKLTVQINAEHAAVRESLQNSREQLRQLLIPEHGSSVDVDISQEQPSTPQQRQQTYALWQEPNILSAATVTTDRAAALSSEPVATGDWLNTVV